MAHIGGHPHITAQPQGQSIVQGDPFKQNHAEWSVGLCSCCDNMRECCYAYCCWCCFMASLASKIDESWVSCCCVSNALGVYRMKVRTILKIKGDACNDCCVVGCLPFCAALQMSTELRNRGLAP